MLCARWLNRRTDNSRYWKKLTCAIGSGEQKKGVGENSVFLNVFRSATRFSKPLLDLKPPHLYHFLKKKLVGCFVSGLKHQHLTIDSIRVNWTTRYIRNPTADEVNSYFLVPDYARIADRKLTLYRMGILNGNKQEV